MQRVSAGARPFPSKHFFVWFGGWGKGVCQGFDCYPHVMILSLGPHTGSQCPQLCAPCFPRVCTIWSSTSSVPHQPPAPTKPRRLRLPFYKACLYGGLLNYRTAKAWTHTQCALHLLVPPAYFAHAQTGFSRRRHWTVCWSIAGKPRYNISRSCVFRKTPCVCEACGRKQPLLVCFCHLYCKYRWGPLPVANVVSEGLVVFFIV